jgi:hypothetical protein
MAEPLTIQIAVPGGPEAARVLQTIAGNLTGVGAAADKAEKSSSLLDKAFAFNQVTAAASSLAQFVGALAEAAAAGEQNARALNALGGSYDAIRTATNGTLTATDAYRASNTLLRSGLHLSGEEFATVARFAREHKDATQSTAEAVQQLSEALRGGEAEGLRQFGIATQEGASRVQTLERALRQMTAANAEAAPAARTLAEEQATLGANFTEATGALANFVSHAVGLPSLMGSVSSALRGVAEGIAAITEAEERRERDTPQFEARTRAQNAYNQALRDAGQNLDRLGVARTALPSANAALLSTEQLVAATARLNALQAQAGTTIAPSEFGRARVAGPVDLTGRAAPRRDFMAELGGLEVVGEATLRRRAEEGLRSISADIGREVEATVRAQREAARQRSQRDTAPTARRADDDKTAKAAEMAADEARRAQQAMDERTSREKRAAQEADARAELQLARDTAAAKLEIQKNELEEERRNSLEARRERASLQRQEEAAARRATLADLRDPAVQREQLDAARMDRTIARERRALDRRADQQQTFTERMRDYYHSDVSAAEEAATGLQGAFQATGEAFAAHAEEFAAGRETMAEALQGMAADALKAIGKQALTKSAYFFAEGLGNLALFNFPGAATAFAASAAYAAIGGGAVALGTAITEPPEAKLAGREEAARKAEEERTKKPQRAEIGTGSRGGKGGEGEGITYNISFGGPMYGTGGVRQAARQMVGAINRGGIQGGVQILPGVLQSTGAGS